MEIIESCGYNGFAFWFQTFSDLVIVRSKFVVAETQILIHIHGLYAAQTLQIVRYKRQHSASWTLKSEQYVN